MEIQGKAVIAFETQRAFEEWLAENHATCDGIWLMISKKGSGTASVTYAEAVESALCYGWIDSQARSYDERFYVQKFTPRRAKSKWSQINCQKAEALIAAGRMQPAGLRQVELAQADGRWEAAYPPPSAMVVSEDLQQALDASPAAQEFFLTLDSANRYAILYRIATAPNPQKRAERIEKFIAMLAAGQKVYP